MILFVKQFFKILRVLCVLKPLRINMRGLLLARSLVLGLNTCLSYCKLMLELVYPDSLHACSYLGVKKTIKLL
jgi:hypothetical protein